MGCDKFLSFAIKKKTSEIREKIKISISVLRGNIIIIERVGNSNQCEYFLKINYIVQGTLYRLNFQLTSQVIKYFDNLVMIFDRLSTCSNVNRDSR